MIRQLHNRVTVHQYGWVEWPIASFVLFQKTVRDFEGETAGIFNQDLQSYGGPPLQRLRCRSSRAVCGRYSAGVFLRCPG